MSAKHTIGPWMADKHGSIFAIGGIEVCDVMGRVGSAQFKANARLIAAAPELLAALENAMDILARAESNASGNPEWDHVGPRVAAVRAAIAKARAVA